MNPLPPSATSNLLVVGGTPSERREAARSLGMPGGRPDAYTLVELPARTLAFQRVAGPPATPTRPRIIRIDELHLAFHDRQTGGTRLVLTQSSYLLQKWLDVLGPEDRIIATAERDLLAAVAPEALKGTGPWRAFCIADVDEVCDDGLGPNVSAESSQSSTVEQDHVSAILADAYESAATAQRVELCREAVAADSSSATARLALASACWEAQDPEAAREALDRTLALAPGWEAVHYEDGKLRLANEDMEGALRAFRRAAELMPTFVAAWSNLGATQGELNRPHEALAAFTQALDRDPDNFMILNNIGVVNRELGHLPESEAALDRVVALQPTFAFGHYNLGHTRFLRGDFAGALRSYLAGQSHDADKNHRQGCRLALVRFATGDQKGAEQDLWHHTDRAPAREREDLLLEAYEIAHALVEAHPEWPAGKGFLDRIALRLTV